MIYQKPDRHVSLSQKAYDRLRARIVSLELAPGQVIDEASLRLELGMGRTPIREALQRLALEKLVTIIPRRGMFVTEIGVTDLQRLFEIRLVLEGQAAELAARRGSRLHWQQMEAVLADLSTADALPDNASLIATDDAFHHLIYEAADNVFLRDVLSTLYALSLRLWYYFLYDVADMHGAVQEHQATLQALMNRDGERAAATLCQHIQHFQEEIQAVMLEMPASRQVHV